MNILGILAIPLGWLMELIYRLIPSYGWTLILFTLIVRVILFPLMAKQQKSTARMAAFQPMINEIQKKWANDKQRQQEELMKFQEESGFSMTAGCLPMLLNLFVMFGVIEVVYRPLRYVLNVSTDLITQAITLANETLGTALVSSNAMVQNQLINVVKANPSTFTELLGDKVVEIQNFNFTFLGIDLSQTPGTNGWLHIEIIIPILAVLTSILSQVLITKMSGQQMQGSMKAMPWIMAIWIAWFSFTVPVGFSLYYTVSNVLLIAQQIILKKMYDPEAIKAQVVAELEAKRAEKKKKKQVRVVAQDGTEEMKDVSQAELDRIRLARARALDEERYKDE